MKQVQLKTTWIDIPNPKQSDVDYLAKNFKFHPIILSELIPQSNRSELEVYDHYAFIVYHLPIYDHDSKTSRSAEIDFLITKDSLITVHYSPIEPIDQLFIQISKNSEVREKFLNKNTGYLLYEILRLGLEFSLRQLNHIDEKIKRIEEGIFKGREKEMIKEISIVKRDLLDQRLISRPQKSILESLTNKGIKFFGREMEVYFNDLVSDYEKIWDTLDNLKETTEALESTNNTLFESKMSEVMKLLTIMAFVTFPLSLISSIFGMNTSYTPLVHLHSGFWIIVAVMAIISTIFVIYFKIKKWL